MKNDSSLNEKGAKLAADLRDYFQQGNVCDSLICLAAQDYYLDNLPDGFTAEQGLAFFFGNQGTLTMHPTTPGWITPVGAFNSNAEKYKAFFKTLREQGINSSDLTKYNYFGEDGKPISISAAIDGIATDLKFTYAPKTPEQLAADAETIAHPTAYGVRTAENGAAQLADFPEIKGLGISSVTTRSIADGTAASFFGGLNVSADMKKQLGKQPVRRILTFALQPDDSIDAKSAAASMLAGRSAIIRKPGSTLECFCINRDGELDPEPFINPASPELGKTDYRKLCGEFYKELKATDRAYVWTNSETFEKMRDLLGVMASPDRMLTKGQQQTAFENLERLTMSYIVKKNVERESKGSLNERSTSRLAIAHRLHAYSRVLKNPDLYKALADNQRRNNQIIQDNPAVGQSGGFPSM